VPFDKIEVISRQDVAKRLDNPNLALEGPRATPMREVLTMSPDAFRQKHPTLSDNIPDTELEYHVWRDAMPDALSDAQVIKFMKLAKSRLAQFD